MSEGGTKGRANGRKESVIGWLVGWCCICRQAPVLS